MAAHLGRVGAKEENFGAVWPESFVEEGKLARPVLSLRRARSGGLHRDHSGPRLAVCGLEGDGIADGLTEHVLVQRMRERAQVVIEESFPAPATVTAPARISLFSLG